MNKRFDRPSDPLVGCVVGRYQLTQKIGAGGMGSVYRAVHTEIPTLTAAVKVLSGQYAESQDLRHRFRDEAAIGARLGELSPRIVQVRDYGLVESLGLPYYTMEFLQGQGLDALVAEGLPVAPERSLPIVLQILEGLAVAHAEGVIHRDLKPSNIFLVPDGQGGEQVKILDFGIAKLMQSASSYPSLTQGYIGTPRYSSPEQVQGQSLSPRSDLYSVGIVLYELLCGAHPFDVKEDTYAFWYHSHGYEQPRPMAQANPRASVPVAIEEVVQSCLAKRPEDRPTDARSLAAQLKRAWREGVQPRAATTLPTTTQIADPVAATAPPVPRAPNYKLWGGLAAVGVLAVAGFFYSGIGPARLAGFGPGEGKTDTRPATDRTNPEGPVEGQSEPRQQQVPPTEQPPGPPTQPGGNPSEPFVLGKPPFRQQLGSAPSGNSLPRLVQVSAQANSITDTDAWFRRIGLQLPTFEVPNPLRNIEGNVPAPVPLTYRDERLVQAIRSDNYLYAIYGVNFSEGRYLLVIDATSGQVLHAFDFDSYSLSPAYLPGEAEFVRQRLTWAQIEGDTLYVAHAHSTYAKSSKGMNAYLTALRLKDGQLLWRSRPLVANSSNFLIVRDGIISGYGFTAEPDFLYVLDKHTGRVTSQLRLKSGPDALLRQGDRLYVRTYDTDYVFKVQ